jgi:hypothetical protein
MTVDDNCGWTIDVERLGFQVSILSNKMYPPLSEIDRGFLKGNRYIARYFASFYPTRNLQRGI